MKPPPKTYREQEAQRLAAQAFRQYTIAIVVALLLGVGIGYLAHAVNHP